jgi:hypothetical protein
MPFAVFRKHQRKMLAIFAILAMIVFVLGDSLSGWVGGRGGGRGGVNDPVLAKLKWKDIHYSDLEPMKSQRQRANYFVIALLGGDPQLGSVFGGTTTRELVDALIFEHEAVELGLPATPEIANRWLRSATGRMINQRRFEEVFRSSSLAEQVTDEQLLQEIANQIRIRTISQLVLTAEATPLDVFDAYQAQTERVSAYAAAVKVEDYVAKVSPGPTDSEVEALYEATKDRLPDPNSPEPGFKVPQKVRFEVVSADVSLRASEIRPTLTTADLRKAHKERPTEFLAEPGELPTSLFARAPDLTPHDAFPDVRDHIARTLAEEKARDEIEEKLTDVKDRVMRTFAEKYYGTDSTEEEKAASGPKPRPGDAVKTAALKAGLTYESTPLVATTAPDLFGAIGKSHLPTDSFMNSTTFAEIAFSPKTLIYDPIDLTDAGFRDEGGRRFLAWKVEEQAARVPTLGEVRDEVVKAWKFAKARPLAEAEAERIAAATRKAGGGAKLRDEVGPRPVVTTEARSKMVPPTTFSMSNIGQFLPVDVAEIPHAGDAVRDAIYDLSPTSVAVAPDAPKSVYYVLTLRSRDEAEFSRLYDFGQATSIMTQESRESRQHLVEEWQETLRKKAGLAPDWAPPNER